jgi:hypothetical protein
MIAAAVTMLIVIPQPLADLDRPSMCAVERVILRTVEPATDPGIWTTEGEQHHGR